MKKILSTFFILLCYVLILVLPVFLGLHSNLMSHHEMEAGGCIEHCLGSETQIYADKIAFNINFIEIFVLRISFKIFDFTLPLVLLYIALLYAPPNLYKKIKNYNYSSLVGTLKLTT